MIHLLVFDLMYCCRTYNYYKGMTHASKKESIKAYTEAEAREKERAARDAQIAEITDELHEAFTEYESLLQKIDA